MKKVGRTVYGSGDTIVKKTSLFFSGSHVGGGGGGGLYAVYILVIRLLKVLLYLNQNHLYAMFGINILRNGKVMLCYFSQPSQFAVLKKSSL